MQNPSVKQTLGTEVRLLKKCYSFWFWCNFCPSHIQKNIRQFSEQVVIRSDTLLWLERTSTAASRSVLEDHGVSILGYRRHLALCNLYIEPFDEATTSSRMNCVVVLKNAMHSEVVYNLYFRYTGFDICQILICLYG